jgi:hypothetical protein
VQAYREILSAFLRDAEILLRALKVKNSRLVLCGINLHRIIGLRVRKSVTFSVVFKIGRKWGWGGGAALQMTERKLVFFCQESNVGAGFCCNSYSYLKGWQVYVDSQ